MLGHALGLGSLTANSALNEPFAAEIQLNSVKSSDFGGLKAELASRGDFQLAEIDRPAHLLLLKFEPFRKPDDSVVLKVSSEEPITEPFLHFLVAVEWAGGKLIREYTTLLDPPLYAQGPGATISSPAAMGDSASRTEATGLAAPSTGEASAAPANVQSSSGDKAMMPGAGSSGVGTSGGSDSGETREGDTLWGIANNHAGSNNIFKVMVAMLRANPDAFVDNNINRLKVGQILKIPTREQIDSLSFKQASDEYLVQLEEWEAYKAQLAGSGQLAKAPPQPAKSKQAPAPPKKQVAKAETKTAAPAPRKPPVKSKPSEKSSGSKTQPPQDLLRIVQSTLDKDKKGEGGAAKSSDTQNTQQNVEAERLTAQISTMEETLLSTDLENKELMERVKMLEEQVKKANRLMQIQNENLALAQQQASEREKAASAAKQRETEAVTKSQQEIAKLKADAEAKAKSEAALAGAMVAANSRASNAAAKPPAKPQAKPATKPKPVKKPTQAKPKKVASKPKPRMSAPPPQKAWWEEGYDMIMVNWIWSALVGFGVLILVVGGLVFMRRRQSIAEFEDSILSGSALDSHTETTGGGVATGTDTSFLSDFGVPGMGTMQADEVDPVAEAEVYLAYGRDEQAEEVLKEAIGRDGSRQELKLKLLEIYAQRNDLSSFETLAEELYPAQGEPRTDIWRKVVEMGHKLNPDNPLFTQSNVTIPPNPTLPPGEQDGDDLLGGATGQVDPRLQPFPEPNKDHDTDLRLQALEKEREPTEPDLEPFPPAEEIGLPDLDLTKLEQDMGTSSLIDDQPTGLDFDLGIDEALSEKTTGGTTTLGDDDQDAAQKTMIAAAPPNVTETKPTVEEDVSADLKQFEMDGLDFGDTMADLETVDTPAATPSPTSTQGGTVESFTLDTDIGELEVTSSRPASGSDEPTLEGLDAGSYDLSMDDEDPTASGAVADDEQWDEAATKLDLAKAYIDMGDESGARSIIDEVLKEGNEGQRKQAAELAAQIAG